MVGIRTMQHIGAIVPLLGTLATGTAGEIEMALVSGKTPVRIVCFGDSITGVYYHTGGRRAWCDMLGIALQSIYPRAKLELHNAGISGNRIPAGLERLQRDVLAYKPHLVIVMFGMNDCLAAAPEAFKENLRTIVQCCRDAGADVVLCTPNSIYPEDPERFANLPAHVDAVRTLSAELSVPLADCYLAYETVRAADPVAWKLLMSETIHPGMNGHRLFAETILETISGMKVVLDAVPPPAPALRFTFDRLSQKQPVTVIAAPPYDTLMPNVLRAIYPDAVIHLTSWPLGTLAEMEQWSQGIRAQTPNLVVVAVPANARGVTDETFIRSYSWILNYSLAFGVAEWDTIAILPSVTERELSGDAIAYANLAQRVIAGSDLSCVVRTDGDDAEPEQILKRWLDAEHTSWTALRKGTSGTDDGTTNHPVGD